MKVICLHHRLGGYGSHHYNEAVSLRRELEARGIPLILLVAATAVPTAVAELGGRALLEDPTFRMDLSFDERTRRFVHMLHDHVDPLLDPGDCVLLTISTQLEAHALMLWLQELPAPLRPWISIVFLSDRWNRSTPEEHDRQIAEFFVVSRARAALRAEEMERVILWAGTDGLARELSGLLGAEVAVSPILLTYDEERCGTGREIGSPPRVSVLGGTRREKGSHRIPAIIGACSGLVAARFLVQLVNDDLPPADVETLAQMVGQPGVTVIRRALTLTEHQETLRNSDIALLPYEAVPYRQRTSGLFAEALAQGIPTVVTPGTWMAAVIAGGRGAGVIAEDHEPDSIARAVALCVSDLSSLAREAQALAPAWRERESLTHFLDLLVLEIERRRAAADVRM